jgi:hypothetical protein
VRAQLLAGLLLTALGSAGQAQASEPKTVVSNVREIPVRPGPNPIAHLAPDGRDGLIVEGGHSDSPSADGSSADYMVLLKATGPDRDWEAVDVQSLPSVSSDAPFGGVVIKAFPHTGEDSKRSVVFARATLDGAPATLLLLADRDMGHTETAYSPAPVQISIFALRTDADTGQDQFTLVRQAWAAKCYIDARWALIEAFKLSPPPGYEGERATSACKAS